MTVDPKKRFSAQQAINHKWFKMENVEQPSPLHVDIINKLRNFRGISKLRKAAMNIIVKLLDSSLMTELRSEFLKIDQENTGLITLDELKKCIK